MKLFQNLFNKKRIYLDHAATTPLDNDVFSAMEHVYKNNYFNPGGLYREGVMTNNVMQESRRSVAKLLGATSDHIIFTRGGTESCNMAIMGVISSSTHQYPSPLRGAPLKGEPASTKLPHIITSAIEHAAVLETLKYLEQTKQIELSIIPVNADGVVLVDEIKKALRPETVLVSIMYVNNEIGTIQPIKEIAKLVRWYRKQHPSPLRGAPLSKGSQAPSYPLLHVDAIQAVNYLDIHVERLGIDLMSLSGSKIYGPKSSGVLYVRNRESVDSVFHGGDQEFGLRAGTEDVAQVVGFTKALEKTRMMSDSENDRLTILRDLFLSEVKKNVSGVIVNGFDSLHGSGKNGSRREPGEDSRICNNINITIPGISGERLVIELDAQGIAVASKSACKEDNGEASHVIEALRPNASATDGAVRFTLGRGTTKDEVLKTVKVLTEIVGKIKGFENSLKV